MRIAALVLAAGESKRFGGRKQLWDIDGEPLIRHSLKALSPLFGRDLYCVLGAYRDEIKPVVKDLAQIIEHPRWRQGMGSSLAAGMGRVDMETYDAVLVALMDQVYLTSRHYRALLDAFQGEEIVAAHYQSRNGVPAIFPAGCFDYLSRLEGDKGARDLLNQGGRIVTTIAMPEAARDVDRRTDLVSA